MKNLFHMVIGLFKNGLYGRLPCNKDFYLQSNFETQLGDQIQFGMPVSLSVRLERSYFQTCKPIFVQYCMVLPSTTTLCVRILNFSFVPMLTVSFQIAGLKKLVVFICRPITKLVGHIQITWDIGDSRVQECFASLTVVHVRGVFDGVEGGD